MRSTPAFTINKGECYKAVEVAKYADDVVNLCATKEKVDKKMGNPTQELAGFMDRVVDVEAYLVQFQEELADANAIKFKHGCVG